MITVDIPAPLPTLVMTTPYVETDEAQRMLRAWITATLNIKAAAGDTYGVTAPLDWQTRAYVLGTEGYDEDIVFDMMESVNQKLLAGYFAEVDGVLRDIRVTEVPLVVIEGLVRFCSRASSHLHHWEDLKGRLFAEAALRGDAEEMLFTP